MKTGTVHTTFGPQDTAVEIWRNREGVDRVQFAGRLLTPSEADEIARLLSTAAAQAAAHNAGALGDGRKAVMR